MDLSWPGVVFSVATAVVVTLMALRVRKYGYTPEMRKSARPVLKVGAVLALVALVLALLAVVWFFDMMFGMWR